MLNRNLSFSITLDSGTNFNAARFVTLYVSKYPNAAHVNLNSNYILNTVGPLQVMSNKTLTETIQYVRMNVNYSLLEISLCITLLRTRLKKGVKL